MSTSSTATFPIEQGKLFINNRWRDPASGETIAVYNPATEEEVARVASANEAEVDLAVAAARKAFDDGPWTKMSPADRGKLMYTMAQLIMKNRDEMAYRETICTGKPISDSRNIDASISSWVWEYYAGWPTKIHGETLPVHGNHLNYTLKEPVGVVAAIPAFNFPLLMSAWKMGPALAAGNTVILKPSPYAPLTALKLAELALEAGFPEGVINVITGQDPLVGRALVRHPGVDMIAFTGSTATGQTIMRDAADTLKRLSLGLSAKSPTIVFADANIDEAAARTCFGLFYNVGQVCGGNARVLVEESVREKFVEALVKHAKNWLPGDPLDPETKVGPVAHKRQFERVMGYLKLGVEEGATVAVGGSRADVNKNGKGYFIQPTVFDNVKPQMRIAREEIFGPVLSTIPFKDATDAIRIANDNMYGLAGSIWTNDVTKAHTMAKKLRAGIIWINTYHVYDPASPFGGFKESGFGKELGPHALDGFLQTKSVWVNMER